MGDNELLCLLDAIPEEDLLRIIKDIVDELLHDFSDLLGIMTKRTCVLVFALSSLRLNIQSDLSSEREGVVRRSHREKTKIAIPRKNEPLQRRRLRPEKRGASRGLPCSFEF